MRRRISLLFVVPLLATGCGGSSTSVKKSVTSRAQAATIGSAVSLKAADLPGYTGTPHAQSDPTNRNGVAFATCAGMTPPSSWLGDFHSDDFRAGSGLAERQVGSSVTVLGSSAAAASDLTAMRSTKGSSCMKTVLDDQLTKALGASGLRFGATSIAPIAPPSSSVPGFAYRLKIPASTRGVALTLYIDVAGFAAGPARVAFQSLTLNRPFDAPSEQRLYGLLIDRARAQHLLAG